MSDVHDRWRADKGDDIKVIDYPLDENSQVIELGGFHGLWTKRISSKFNCNVLVIEAIPDFYNKMVEEFDYYLKDNRHKIKTENFGISTVEKEVTFAVDGDATSSYLNSSNKVTVKCLPLEHFLDKHSIERIDLIQINVEGEEYPLLENWIESGLINKIKLGFTLRYEYPFVWESWENTNI